MPKRAQSLGSLTQGRLEPLISSEYRLEAEDLPGGRGRVVEHQQTIAKTVRVSLRVPRRQSLVPLGGGRELIGIQILSWVHCVSVPFDRGAEASINCGCDCEEYGPIVHEPAHQLKHRKSFFG